MALSFIFQLFHLLTVKSTLCLDRTGTSGIKKYGGLQLIDF